MLTDRKKERQILENKKKPQVENTSSSLNLKCCTARKCTCEERGAKP